MTQQVKCLGVTAAMAQVVTVAQVQSLDWEFLYAVTMAKEQKKKRIRRLQSFHTPFPQLA